VAAVRLLLRRCGRWAMIEQPRSSTARCATSSRTT